jgi:predicted DNA-binding protein
MANRRRKVRFDWECKIRLPRTWRRRLKRRVERSGGTMNGHIRMAVAAYLDTYEKVEAELAEHEKPAPPLGEEAGG